MKKLSKTCMTACLFFVSISNCIAIDNHVAKRQNLMLEQLKNFRLISSNLASSGMPTFLDLTLLKQNGYQHIVNLIPGDFSDQQEQVSSLGMSFEQIEVDWNNPTIIDFKHFVSLMNSYHQNKVLVHCRLNYRASAFMYLYQVTQLGVDDLIAKQQMLTVWQPEGIWLDYIRMVKKFYKKKNE